jgi:hypothetical protein
MKRTQILWGAAALLFVATAAQAQQRQDEHHDRQDQRAQVAPPGQRGPRDGNPGRAGADAQRRELEQARSGQARVQEMENQRRNAQFSEQQRALETRQRERQAAELQMRQREQAGELERTRQPEERERLAQAERRAELNRAYVPGPVYRPGYDFRYRIGGVYRETNQFGVDVLRRAVSLGYQRGYDAGLRDFRDRVAPDYRLAFDYQAGNYGYTPDYVPESDYSYYFREGFQRGYDDAFWNRAQYGTFSNGTASVLGDVLAGILGLTLMH